MTERVGYVVDQFWRRLSFMYRGMYTAYKLKLIVLKIKSHKFLIQIQQNKKMLWLENLLKS